MTVLQQTLANWRQWQTSSERLVSMPSVVRELLGGKTNRSFLVACDEFRAVVRVNAQNSQRLGIDRQRERLILQYLQPTGCVPEVLYSTDEVLVTRYCEGRHPTADDIQSPVFRKLLNDCLQKIQAVPAADLPRRNYQAYCQAYLQQLPQTDKIAARAEPILAVAAALDGRQWPAVVCHHDLVPENVIITPQGLMILDWEYAALGHPQLDFVRFYGTDRGGLNVRGLSSDIERLAALQQGMDDLWLLVQNTCLEVSYE